MAHRAFSPQANLPILLSLAPPGRPATPPAMMPGQIPDPSVTAGSLPGLGPLTGLPSSALTTEELKYADIRNIGAMIAPLHFLEVKLGKRPQPVKSEVRPLFSRENSCFQVWFETHLGPLVLLFNVWSEKEQERQGLRLHPRHAVRTCIFSKLWEIHACIQV